MQMKTITFTDTVFKTGHPASDYKKDGTLKKNRQEPRQYDVRVQKKVKCRELVIQGKHIGYVRPDKYDSWIDGYPTVYNSKGEPVLCAFSFPSSWSIRKHGFEVFKAHTKNWILDRPSWGNAYYIPLWICDDNEEPKYVFKSNYKLAKDRYTFYKYTEQYPWYYNREYLFTPEPGWKTLNDLEQEFDAKYKDMTIDLECGWPCEYL